MANCLIFLVFVSFLQVHFQRQKNATSVTETTDPPEDSVTVTKNVFISYYCSCFSNSNNIMSNNSSEYEHISCFLTKVTVGYRFFQTVFSTCQNMYPLPPNIYR